MTSHDHDLKHAGCCEHKRIKFCRKCGVPYCLDCGKEWVEKAEPVTVWPWTYPGTAPYQPDIIYGTGDYPPACETVTIESGPFSGTSAAGNAVALCCHN